jgi:hypothetical protein
MPSIRGHMNDQLEMVSRSTVTPELKSNHYHPSDVTRYIATPTLRSHSTKSGILIIVEDDNQSKARSSPSKSADRAERGRRRYRNGFGCLSINQSVPERNVHASSEHIRDKAFDETERRDDIFAVLVQYRKNVDCGEDRRDRCEETLFCKVPTRTDPVQDT